MKMRGFFVYSRRGLARDVDIQIGMQQIQQRLTRLFPAGQVAPVIEEIREMSEEGVNSETI